MSPIVTAGLPAPGPRSPGLVPVAAVVDLLELLPHAPSASAAASVDVRPPRGAAVSELHVIPPGWQANVSGAVIRRRHRNPACGSRRRSRRSPRGVSARWSSAKRGVDGEGERGHADRRPEDAGQAVARLVGDDVAERPAVAGQRGDRRRGHDEHRGDANAGEERSAAPGAARPSAGSAPRACPSRAPRRPRRGRPRPPRCRRWSASAARRGRPARPATFQKPSPMKATPIAITASSGRARPMLARLMATNEPRWRWPSQTPSGRAMAQATAMADAADLELLEREVHERRVAGLVDAVALDELERLDEVVHRARAHGVRSRWSADEEQVGQDGQRDRQARRRRSAPS